MTVSPGTEAGADGRGLAIRRWVGGSQPPRELSELMARYWSTLSGAAQAIFLLRDIPCDTLAKIDKSNLIYHFHTQVAVISRNLPAFIASSGASKPRYGPVNSGKGS